MELRSIIKDILKENENILIKDLKKRDFDTKSLIKKRLNKIITLTGFRRVGKTYLLFLILEKIRDQFFIYFNFEDERIPEATKVFAELMYSIEELYETRPTYLLFDEIHIIPGWGKFLRRTIDKEYKIFVTGSSSKLGLKEIPTELRGRTINYTIFPLSFNEYLHFKTVDIKELYSQKIIEIKRIFREFLIYGGFPEIYDANELERKEVIQEYFRTLVQRDLIERFNIREEALLDATVKLLLNSVMVSISKLTKTLKSMGFRCSKNTISNYISYLEKSFFIFQVLYYSKNVKDQMQYPRKIYLIDNGFIKYLSFNPNEARFLENIVAVELKRRGNEFYYWRNQKGEEVDFVVVENEMATQLIQVSYDISLTDTKERETRALIKGIKHFGLKKGLILTFDSEEIIKSGEYELEVKPVWKWLLNI
ncbi:MAG: ATP-binding protein [Candidatus Aminicenantes bacterium]|nr:ATP-binding protein [Candidatus Aminicenantes bacterium]MBL7082575.1 ATP-binding protein [Candidatus Aminicenantes bacterium]